LGSPQKLHTTPTEADINALLSCPHDVNDPKAVSDVAFSNGLHLPAPKAVGFLESIRTDEAAWQQLKQHGLFQLKRKLRTEAPLCNEPARLPALGTAVGDFTLPGPQPTMTEIEMEQIPEGVVQKKRRRASGGGRKPQPQRANETNEAYERRIQENEARRLRNRARQAQAQ
jgi:hypothetical protein